MKSINSRRMNFVVKQRTFKVSYQKIFSSMALVITLLFIPIGITESYITENIVPEKIEIETATVENPVVENPVVENPVVENPVAEEIIPEKVVIVETPVKNMDTPTVEKDLASLFESYKIPGLETLEKDKTTNSIKLTLSSDSFFQIGTAVLKEDSQIWLNEIVEVIKSSPSKMMVEVEGHTDDSPVIKQKKLYQSNWELSTARATLMVHAFESAGFGKELLKVIGYGDSRPILPNRTPSGEAITSNLIKNRRIVLRVSQVGSDQKSL